MRQFFRSSAGFVALIIMGLVIGVAGTATSAKLITGKDIKDGTITAKDIKPGAIGEKQLSESVKSKLEITVTQGVQGPKGDAGADGKQGSKGDPGANAPGGFIVKDGDGDAVDGFVSVSGPLRRVWDGGLWDYSWDGTIEGGGLAYEDESCQGTPFAWNKYGPQFRITDVNGQAYRLAGTPAQSKVIKAYQEGGICTKFSSPSDVFALVPVPSPPPLRGPLTVYANP